MPYIANTPWESENREIEAFLTIISNNLATDDECATISAVDIESELVSTKNLSFGNTCSAKATIVLKKVKRSFSSFLRKGTPVALELDCKASGTPVGYVGYYLYIDEISITESREMYTENGTDYYYNDITVICYDVFYKTELPYVPTITISENAPKNLLTVAKDVMKVAGFVSDSIEYIQDFSTSLTITSVPENITCREMLGYLAGFQGGNCVAGAGLTDSYDWYPYISVVVVANATEKTVSQDEQYMDEYVVDGNLVEINRVESGTAESMAVYPSNGEIGNSISYENPYIQNDEAGLARVQEIQEDVISKARAIQGISADSLDYTPMTIKWRGNPDIIVGDMIKVEDKYGNTQYCFVMGKSISFDGGLSETYRCYGETEKSVSFTINPVMKQIERRLTQMEEAILEATEIITDVESMQEGVFEFIPNAGGTANIGWKIASSSSGRYIVGNINGIGFSSDGSAIDAIALYFDSEGHGHINGNYIAANSITTDQIAIGTGNSGLTQELRNLANQQKLTHYCTCSTGSSTVEKAVSSSDEITSLVSGMMISVYFSNANTASSPKLNLNNLGAKSISAQGDLYKWKAGSTLNFTYNGSNWVMTNLDTESKLRALCSNNDMTYIAGSHIATGSITASQIASHTITASEIASHTITTDRLNVGTGILVEKFVNPNLSGENKNWVGIQCRVARVSLNGEYWLAATPNTGVTDFYGVVQYVHLEKGKRYKFTANFLIDAVSSASNGYIETICNKVSNSSSWQGRTGDNEAISVGTSSAQQMVYSLEFSCDETNTYAVGIMFNRIFKSSSTLVSTYFKWFSLVEIPDDSSLDLEYLSYSNWVSSQYLIDYSSNADTYKTDFSLTIDSNGNLLTLGNLNSNQGAIGCLAFNNDGANISSVSSYYTGSTYYHTDSIQFIKPESYISNFNRGSSGLVYRLSEAFNRIELVSYAGELNTSTGAVSNFSLEGETVITPLGIAVNNGSYISEMRAASVASTAFSVFSREEIKKNIIAKKSVTNLFKASTVYDYELKATKSGNRRTGFVIGRETPEEIISDDGNGIDLYSTISITWKAIQEILERLDKLEGGKI